jgi:hypothetical protein
MRFLVFFFSFSTMFAQKQVSVKIIAPPTKNNPSIQVFLKNLRLEEEKYSQEEQNNVILMTTRLRKIFYSSPNYDKYLIKGVADISAPYSEAQEIDVPSFVKTIETPLGLEVELIDKVTYTSDTTGHVSPLRENLYTSQEVAINTREVADLGHVLCGVDAAFHPSAVAPPKILGIQWTRIRIDKNIDAVTWVGDLGSAVAEVYFAERLKKRKLTIVEQQEVIDMMASAADMLGNIDTYNIMSLFQEKNKEKVTDIFEKYYLSDAKKYSDLRKQRYVHFAKVIGLIWNGKSFDNYDKMLRYYTDQVNDSAAFHYAISAKRSGKWNLVKAIPSILRMSRNAYAKVIVASFFDELAERLKG